MKAQKGVEICNKQDEQNAHNLIFLIYNTPTCFGPHWPIIRECGCTKQLIGHPIISNARKCGEIINVRFIETNTYTIIGATCRLYCVHGRNIAIATQYSYTFSLTSTPDVFVWVNVSAILDRFTPGKETPYLL
jgi:hypothetical protein